MRTLSSLWNDEAGFIVSAELVLLSSLLVIGLITGIGAVQESVIGEYEDVAGAIRSLDQSYAYNGMHGCVQPACGGFSSWTAGSGYSSAGTAPPPCFDYSLLPGPVPVPVAPPAVVTPPVPVPAVPVPAPCAPVQTVGPAPACAPTSVTLCNGRSPCAGPAACPCPAGAGPLRASSVNADYGYADPRPLMGPLVW